MGSTHFCQILEFFFWILNTRVICIMISHMGGLRLFVLASFEASYNDWSRARNFVSYAMICSPFSCFVRICIGYGGWTHQDMCIRFKTEVYILGSPAVCLYMNQIWLNQIIYFEPNNLKCCLIILAPKMFAEHGVTDHGLYYFKENDVGYGKVLNITPEQI